MDYRHLPDAPESVKYHGGYDPADPPASDDDENPFTDRCPKCRQWSNPDEADENGLCPNCSPETQLKQTSTQEITGVVSVLKYFNRRFGINE